MHLAKEEDERMVFYTDLRSLEVFHVEKIGDDLTPQELKDYAADVKKAKPKELRNWHQHGAFKPVSTSQAIMCGTPMRSRWVIKWKTIRGVKSIRARMCMGRFMDPQINQLVTAAAAAASSLGVSSVRSPRT